MRLLLDTHVLIWALALPHRLTEAGRALIADEANDITVSAVSILEIALKRGAGRGDLPPVSAITAHEKSVQAGFHMLDVTAAHAALVETLPNHHGDPFDRLLVAQALSEPLRLLTHDKALARYSDTVICFG